MSRDVAKDRGPVALEAVLECEDGARAVLRLHAPLALRDSRAVAHVVWAEGGYGREYDLERHDVFSAMDAAIRMFHIQLSAWATEKGDVVMCNGIPAASYLRFRVRQL